jgi:UDP-N-acetylglucosamine--N-acetylmuramyl-(pentapeptide) pyrophosphoryl-undecaprenol N-acetylglucosamine transferase
VFGGSLGARRLNDAALGLYDRWRDRTDVAIVHVAGKREHERCEQLLVALRRASDGVRYELVAYEEQMARVYSTATAVVCRAGAVTIAELAATGTPAVLVPLPGAPHDHQTRNAEAMMHAGAAVVVPDAELDGDRLAAELDRLLADAARLDAMAAAGLGMARPDATARVADMVEDAARAA